MTPVGQAEAEDESTARILLFNAVALIQYDGGRTEMASDMTSKWRHLRCMRALSFDIAIDQVPRNYERIPVVQTR